LRYRFVKIQEIALLAEISKDPYLALQPEKSRNHENLAAAAENTSSLFRREIHALSPVAQPDIDEENCDESPFVE